MKAWKGFLLNSKVILSLVGATAIIATTAVIVFNDGEKKSADITSIMERYMSDFGLEYNDQDIVLISTLKAAGYEIEIDDECFNDSYIQINVDEEGKYSFELIKVCTENDVTIELNGDAKVKVEFGATYVEQGATASVDGHDVSSAIKITDNIDYEKLGTYTVTYSVIRNGKESTATRSVEIVDTTAPSILLKNSYVMSVVLGDKFVEPGYRAVDKYDGDVTKNVLVEGNVDTKRLGTYIISYSVTDASGNLQTAKRTVNVVEAVSPIITLKGFGKVNIEYKSVYKDSGYEATDRQNGNITSKVVTTVYNEAGKTISAVDTNTLGTYTIVYKVTNTYGKSAEVRRMVVVENTKAPRLDILGNVIVNAEICKYNTDGTLKTDCAFNYPTVIATDIYKDKNITSDVKRVGSVDVTKLGTYILTYSVTAPSNGMVTTKQITVNVVDTIAPVISLNGEEEVTIEVGEGYTDAGAYAIDNYDGKTTITYDNPEFNPNVVGEYELTYTATDSNNNKSETVKRIVHVVDTKEPIINIEEETVKIYNDEQYNVMDKVTASDVFGTYFKNLTEDITYQIVAEDETNNTAIESVEGSNNVYIFNNPGTYIVTYTVADRDDETALSATATKTIIVYDSKEPIINIDLEGYTLDENNNIIVEAGHIFTMPGYEIIDNYGGLTTATIKMINSAGNDVEIEDFDTTILDTYSIYYSIDNDKKTDEVIITVIVQDKLPTEITFDTEFVFEAGQFIDIFNGIHVSDNLDGVLSSKDIEDAIKNGKLTAVGVDDKDNLLDPEKPKVGTYETSYTYVNSNGKLTTVTRTVIVENNDLLAAKVVAKDAIKELFEELYGIRNDYGNKWENIVTIKKDAYDALNCADLFTEVDNIKLGAIEAMRRVVPLEKAELKAIVEHINGLNANDYTDVSFGEFITAKNAADEMPEGTQEETDAKLEVYQAALAKLVLKVSVARDNKFAEIKAKYDEKLYTIESWSAFIEKLNVELAELTTLELINGYTGTNAILLLDKKPEVKLEEAKMTTIDAILGAYKEEDYTIESWTAFVNAVETAVNSVEKIEDLQDFKLPAVETEKLVTKLEQAHIDRIATILGAYKEEDYTIESWTAFVNAVKSAVESVSDIKDVPTYELENDEAKLLVTWLQAAKDAKINSILNIYIVDKNDYTEESWNSFENTIKSEINTLDSIGLVEGYDYVAVANVKLIKLAEVLLAEEKTKTIDKVLDSYEKNKDIYTTTSWNLFETAVKAIVNSFTDIEDVKKYELTTEVNILNKTPEKLLEEAREAKLNSILVSYNADDYTEESWENFVKAVTSAISELSGDDLENYTVTNEANGLSDTEAAALAKLRANKLEAILQSYSKTDYTEESWADFVDNLTSAISVLSEADLEVFDGKTYESVLFETDATKLAEEKNKKIAEVFEGYNESEYTEDSWELFESVVKALINSFNDIDKVKDYLITNEKNILVKVDLLIFNKPASITTVDNEDLPTYTNVLPGQVAEYTPSVAGVDFTFKAGDMEGTKNVRAEVSVKDSTGNDATDKLYILAKESNGTWWNLVLAGWGHPVNGFEIYSGYSATTTAYFISEVADTYTITFKFIDVSDDSEVMVLEDTIKIDSSVNPNDNNPSENLLLSEFTTESVEAYQEALESGDEDAIFIAKANLEFVESTEEV